MVGGDDRQDTQPDREAGPPLRGYVTRILTSPRGARVTVLVPVYGPAEPGRQPKLPGAATVRGQNYWLFDHSRQRREKKETQQ